VLRDVLGKVTDYGCWRYPLPIRRQHMARGQCKVSRTGGLALPLRGARGSAAQFPATTLALGRPPRLLRNYSTSGEPCTGYDQGRHRTDPYGGPAEALPVFWS